MRRRFAHARDIEFLKQRIEVRLTAAAVRLHHFEHRADVVLDVQAAENRRFLRQIADTEPGALVHRQRGDVIAIEFDAAAVGVDQAGDHVEHRGLAGAVRAEQADRLAPPHIERDALHHHAAAETFLNAVRRQIGVTLQPADRRRRAARRAPASGLRRAAARCACCLRRPVAVRVAAVSAAACAARASGDRTAAPAPGRLAAPNSERIFTSLPRSAIHFRDPCIAPSCERVTLTDSPRRGCQREPAVPIN